MESAANMAYYEQYECGCVSDNVSRKRELLGYCATHGNSSTGVHRTGPSDTARQMARMLELTMAVSKT